MIPDFDLASFLAGVIALAVAEIFVLALFAYVAKGTADHIDSPVYPTGRIDDDVESERAAILRDMEHHIKTDRAVGGRTHRDDGASV